MLSNFLEQKILEHLQLEPTDQQKELIFELARFITSEDKEIFILKGFAGTGKTTVISALVNAISEYDYDPVLLAPTGRAAKVFSTTARQPAYTIHKEIYRIKDSKKLQSKFVLNFNKHKNAIFIIDEASMISDKYEPNSIFGSGRLLDDLIDYVFTGKNCKIVFSGDTAQLPPVGSQFSPALEISTFNRYGKKAQNFELTEVVRQSLESGILYNATLLRQMISEQIERQYPKFKTEGFEDFLSITGSDLIETISDSYYSVGEFNTIVVTRSNKRANRYNQGIRQAVLYRENEFSTDDLIMIVKNNYFWKDPDYTVDFIANGDLAQIVRIKSFEELYNKHFANTELYFPDYDFFIDAKILLDTIYSEKASMSSDEAKEFFDQIIQAYEDVKPTKLKYEKVKKDKHLNALQVKFAYAVTCHKAQGGQWANVFVDQAYINEEMLNLDYYRWLYTAITRATDKIYLVNFKEDFFE